MLASDEFYMIDYGTRYLGRRQYNGDLCEFRQRLSGWPDGLKFWCIDYRIVTHIGVLWDSYTHWMRLPHADYSLAPRAF